MVNNVLLSTSRVADILRDSDKHYYVIMLDCLDFQFLRLYVFAVKNCKIPNSFRSVFSQRNLRFKRILELEHFLAFFFFFKKKKNTWKDAITSKERIRALLA